MFTTTTFTTSQFTKTLRLGLAAAAAVAVTGLAGCASNDDPSSMPGMDHGSSSSAPAAPSSSAAAPTASGTPAAGPHNNADVMFTTMMIPHHQQAIEMSDMILAKDGIDPAVTELARQIKDAQTPEITQMRGWLAGWGANPSPSMSGMDHGDGMMDPADMEALEKASGAEAAKLFLTSMVKHHQGAIAMAQTEESDGQNPEAKQLAQAIITSQQAEIEKMNTLLAQL
jgi:uncharacterized protein (DUF305 family)